MPDTYLTMVRLAGRQLKSDSVNVDGCKGADAEAEIETNLFTTTQQADSANLRHLGSASVISGPRTEPFSVNLRSLTSQHPHDAQSTLNTSQLAKHTVRSHLSMPSQQRKQPPDPDQVSPVPRKIASNRTPSASPLDGNTSESQRHGLRNSTHTIEKHIVPSLHSMPNKRKQPPNPDQASPVPKKIASNRVPLEGNLDGNTSESNRHGPRKGTHTVESLRDDDISDVLAIKSPLSLTEPSFRTWLQQNEERNLPPHPPHT